MPRCGCQDACSCLLVAGPGVNVDGLGTVDRPYEISAESALLTENLVFDNVGTVDFSTSGLGTPVSPLRVSANAALKLTDLLDVETGAPLNGEVPVWTGSQWTFQTVAGGSGGSAVTVKDPITGQGTAAAPLGLGLTLGTGLLGQGTAADPLRANPVTPLYNGQAFCTASFNLTATTVTDIGGATLTVPVASTSSVYLVTLTIDIATILATANTFLGMMNVGGVQSTQQVVWIPTTGVGPIARTQISQTYRYTGLPAGNQIFKAVAQCSTANQFRIASTHTSITVQQVA